MDNKIVIALFSMARQTNINLIHSSMMRFGDFSPEIGFTHVI